MPRFKVRASHDLVELLTASTRRGVDFLLIRVPRDMMKFSDPRFTLHARAAENVVSVHLPVLLCGVVLLTRVTAATARVARCGPTAVPVALAKTFVDLVGAVGAVVAVVVAVVVVGCHACDGVARVMGASRTVRKG